MTLAPMRPNKLRRSTLRRHATIKALIAELTLRDMNHLAVAEFLDCSYSAARTYTKQLREAGVVILAPRRERFIVDHADFSITTDSDAIADFLDSLARAGESPVAHASGFNGLLNGQRVQIRNDDATLLPVHADKPPARRDPLVSALFGRRDLA